jgi:hypothetical protein
VTERPQTKTALSQTTRKMTAVKCSDIFTNHKPHAGKHHNCLPVSTHCCSQWCKREGYTLWVTPPADTLHADSNVVT